MKQLAVLIKPASSACDMRCKYCFYHDISTHREVKSFGKMKQDVMEKIIDQTFVDLNDGDTMTFAFQGGEPTLAGLSYFENFVAYVNRHLTNRHSTCKKKNVTIKYALQTNGLTIDEQWCSFLSENEFLVGLSIDGPKPFHDENRHDHKHLGTHKRIMKTKGLFDRYQVEYNVLCVLTKQIARHPQKIFNFLLKENIKYVQFIPCLDELDCKSKSLFALEPEEFASFYHLIFKLWKQALDQGNYISIKLFDDIIYFLRTGQAVACGMLGKCQSQYVIEADGSTYPCDFYVLDNYKMGNLTEVTISEMRVSAELMTFLHDDPRDHAEFCNKCPFLQMCFGGCKRMKNCMYVNEAQTFCGYQSFLNKNFNHLQQLAMFL